MRSVGCPVTPQGPTLPSQDRLPPDCPSPDLGRVLPRGQAVPLQALHVINLVHLDLKGFLQRASQGQWQVHPLAGEAGLAAQGSSVGQWGRDQPSPLQTCNREPGAG